MGGGEPLEIVLISEGVPSKIMTVSPPFNVVAVGLSLLLGGCVSPGFDNAWRQASPGNQTGSERWEGRWESQRGGVGGRMRAVLCPESDGHVQAYFEARWKCFLTAYKVSLKSQARKGFSSLSGEQTLDTWVGGGVYRYDGTLRAEELRATYDSHHDKGTFHLEPSSVLHPPCTQ